MIIRVWGKNFFARRKVISLSGLSNSKQRGGIIFMIPCLIHLAPRPLPLMMNVWHCQRRRRSRNRPRCCTASVVNCSHTHTHTHTQQPFIMLTNDSPVPQILTALVVMKIDRRNCNKMDLTCLEQRKIFPRPSVRPTWLAQTQNCCWLFV